MQRKYILFLLWSQLFLIGCSSSEQKKPLIKGEYIHRSSDEWLFNIPSPLYLPRSSYPWENKYAGHHMRITKEFFRCKGSSFHPIQTIKKEGQAPRILSDCRGKESHSLPLREDKEFIYPALLELLNFLQQKTERRVIVTSGHQCPAHHAYCHGGSLSLGVKHQLGAEVDFYLEGLEHSPEQVIPLLMEYYKETAPFKEKVEFTQFQRYEKGTDTSTLPWYNKEIFIKLYLAHEGRDDDNDHPYPYLTLQLRYDRDLNASLPFDSKQAQNFRRY